ncbi:zinc metallopeptidase [Atopobium sp. oral taxon 199]|uniref:zinc metallopeptidase n=1 Tax=Atopobium sp. oral taxon 199 TaxID=712156 RepID=UPI00034E124C|nr:zinc metallopeptidase [Atopobium sp. oral taxon 199]EPD77957.1 hypothetical protein HMPREF1527_00259 [Atopobium sp. oral taxon 199 str. F0494]
MYYYGGSDMFYWVLVLGSLALGGLAQLYIHSMYKKWSRVSSGIQGTGADVARRMLDDEGAKNVGIERIEGNLTDNYDPRSNVLHLSDANFEESSVASIAVACHEAGHAVQTARGFWPARLRSALVPVVNLASAAWIYVFIAGVWFRIAGATQIAILLYAATVLFQIVTLPVEIDASRRGLAYLGAHVPSTFNKNGARQVLVAAALTYVAAALVSAIQLLYLISNSRSRD